MITEDRQSSLVALEELERFRFHEAMQLSSHRTACICEPLLRSEKQRKEMKLEKLEVPSARASFFLVSTVLTEALLEMLGFLK